MNAQSDILRRAMEALESVCMMAPVSASVPEPEPAPLPPKPSVNLDHWREPLARWMDAECIGHWRLHEGVGRLHVAFSEWMVGQGMEHCTRSTFERLLLEQGWDIHCELKLVDGLMLRKSLRESGYFPELLSRRDN
jgi:hypothetical protein